MIDVKQYLRVFNRMISFDQFLTTYFSSVCNSGHFDYNIVFCQVLP